MIIDRKIMLTEEGLKKVQEELNYLKRVKRKEIAEKIRNAVTFGEIAENAEYNAAKNEQSFIEGRILALEKIIENYELIDKQENPDCVLLGSEVLIKDTKSKKERKYTILDYVESEPDCGKISISSPIGRALLGKKKGDLVEVRVPAGHIKYKILDIK
ncbi:MAG: transcription elongation factor GreA [Candidatus Caldatribacteriota bacterium]|nr:transcription elongation factor GreA [Candidatus Caldatribacteriota bacterium]